MDIKFTSAKCHKEDDGMWLMLKLDRECIQNAMKFVYEIKDKLYAATIKEFRKKRSLDANAYLWVLLDKIADAVGSTKDDIYLQVLELYGVFTHIIVKEEAVEQFKKEFRTCRELGKVAVNGKTGVQLQCYLGSSTYDTKQMSRLIEGVVSDCKELGIETLTPKELALMCEEWGK